MHLATSSESIQECLFCMVARRPLEHLSWHDQPLALENRTGVAIPAVGALTPGYVLVAPFRHESSLQRLRPDRAAAFIAFLEQVISSVEEAFGPATIFEHGSCQADDRRRSACITHSHIHVVPGRYSFDSLNLETRRFLHLSEIVDARRPERDEGYLMYREPGEVVRLSPDIGVSQFFRRHIANQLGRPDEWDYALFPHWPNVRATWERLSKHATTVPSLTSRLNKV